MPSLDPNWQPLGLALNAPKDVKTLNENLFSSLENAREKIEAWRGHYNSVRPHQSLDYLTPSQFLLQSSFEKQVLLSHIT